MGEHILNMLPLKEEEKALFEALAPDATHVYARRREVSPEVAEKATVILGWIRPECLPYAKNLKWFQAMWAGTNEYEGPGILPEGAMMTNSSGSNSRSVAEHMLAMLLSLCRCLPVYRDHQRAHNWTDEGPMRTILGSTVLIVGTGHIGSDFARMCRDLGAYTVGVRRTVKGSVDGFDEVHALSELDELLPQADVVAMAIPHADANVHLMDEHRFALMKDDAIFLNAGRGSTVDEQALADVMQAGKLWGAGLDVTEVEPLPKDSPLWDIPNLLLSPHIAGGMRLEISRKGCIDIALENLRRYINGEELLNRVR